MGLDGTVPRSEEAGSPLGLATYSQLSGGTVCGWEPGRALAGGQGGFPDHAFCFLMASTLRIEQVSFYSF